MTMNEANVTRRGFLTGAAALSGVAAMAGLAAGANTLMPESAYAAEEAVDWLGEAPAVDEADLVETVDTEILVIGNGMSGTVCAVVAAENGADVVLIDKNPAGVGLRSSAISAVNSRYQQEKGVEIDKMDLLNDVTGLALGQCNQHLIKSWIDNSADVVNWLGDLFEANGFTFHLEYNMPEGTRYKMWPTGHGTVDMDDVRAAETDVLAAVMAHFAEVGGNFLPSTKMIALIKEDDKVVGAYAETEEGIIRINASKGVVVATGGYVNNIEMYKALQAPLNESLSGNLNFGTAMGDGIKACIWAGAHLELIPTTMIFDRGAVTPDVELGPSWETNQGFHFITFATQPFLKVAKDGRRICNESSPYDFIVHAAMDKPGRAWYPIWDSSYWEDVERFATIGCSTLYSREGSNHHAPEQEGVAENMQQGIDNGFIIQADTLEELAEGLQLTDVDAFVAEVENYNRMYEAGYDDQFGKDAFRLSAIDEPPYYGMKMGGLSLCTLDGIVINDKYQALDDNSDPIEGLYVIGNDSGCFYGRTYPNFGAGTNAGRCAAAGWVLGHALAE